ncbi:MAG: hypothetical protein RSE54_10575 [Ruthenibacterium sp.]
MTTFYSVTYAVLGADHPETAWFASKAEAAAFSGRDYYDAPVAHRCKNPETIAKYAELAEYTRNLR